MVRFARILFLAIIPLLVGCSAFYNLEPIEYRHHVALFRLDAADFPDDAEVRAEMPALLPLGDFRREQCMAMLGNLEYQREQTFTTRRDRIYFEGELQEVCYNLVNSLSALPDDHRMVVISRFDPDRSVLSRMTRTTVLLWRDEAGVNVVFGLIREQYTEDDYELDRAWTKVPVINLRRSYPDLRLIPDGSFEFKEVRGNRHHTWAVFSEETLATLQYVAPAGEAPEEEDEENETATEPDGENDLNARLERLKEAYERGLITEDEYNSKREELLREF